MLFIVSTPIGNLKDITLRAIDTLREVDLILAEDTRRTGKLLKEYMIKDKEMISYNDINKTRITQKAIELLKQGKDLALVSDSAWARRSFCRDGNSINARTAIMAITGRSPIKVK